MGFRINTNIMSLNAQRNLGISSKALQRALERLSSGSRINRAGDDAAGLAISEGLGAQVRGIKVAIRNANDAIGFLNTAEGALAELTNITQRLRELGIQSANGTLGSDDRSFLNSEKNQLIEEFDRIARQTNFNGSTLLDGNFTTTDLQVGVNKGETISFNIGDARASALGSLATVSGGQNLLSASTANLVVNNIAIAQATSSDDTVSSSGNAFSAVAVAKRINDKSGTTKVRAEVQSTIVKAYALDFSSFTNLTTGDFQINNVDITGSTSTAADFIDAVNNKSNQTGVKARFQTGSSSSIEFFATDGRNIEFNFSGAYYTATSSLSAFTNSFLSVFSNAQNYTTVGVFGATSQTLSVDFTGLHTGAIKLRSADPITVSGTSISTA
ncbi:MAG TPA: hypothetical protein VM260_04760, partial [Pirellula sp.]|nr:hypothetical protein [Pirellula sp.]